MSPGVNNDAWLSLTIHLAIARQKNLFKNVNVVSFGSQRGANVI
jgi:hypothetical protein